MILYISRIKKYESEMLFGQPQRRRLWRDSDSDVTVNDKIYLRKEFWEE
jgi:hypothetical protein